MTISTAELQLPTLAWAFEDGPYRRNIRNIGDWMSTVTVGKTLPFGPPVISWAFEEGSYRRFLRSFHDWAILAGAFLGLPANAQLTLPFGQFEEGPYRRSLRAIQDWALVSIT